MQAGICVSSPVAVTWQAKQPNVTYYSELSVILWDHNFSDIHAYATDTDSCL